MSSTLYSPGGVAANIIPFDPNTGKAGYSVVVTQDELALRNGAAYIAATGPISVGANNYANLLLVNTSTVKTMLVDLRQFDNSSGSTIVYSAYRNPAALTGTTSVGVGSRSGVATPSIATLVYAMGTTDQFASATAISRGLILPNSSTAPTPTFMIPPGQSRGFTFAGNGGGLTAAAVVDAIFAWAEITL